MNFYITILGSGAALPTGARHCSAQVLNIGGMKVLLDCAEGTQDRIRQNHIKMQGIGTILISHLHGDHFFGLPGLLSTMHLCGRTEPVTIIAPKGAKEATETLFDLSGNHIDYPIDWREMDFEEGEKRVFGNNRCTIDAFPIIHSVPTYGFRICAGGQTYAYCCDTAFDEAIASHINGADLLCLECTFANQLSNLAETRQHLTAGQAGKLAALAGVKTLLLSHISARYKDNPEILTQEATQEFENCILAADGMRIDVVKGIMPPTTQTTEK